MPGSVTERGVGGKGTGTRPCPPGAWAGGRRVREQASQGPEGTGGPAGQEGAQGGDRHRLREDQRRGEQVAVCAERPQRAARQLKDSRGRVGAWRLLGGDRKSTRLNSSH